MIYVRPSAGSGIRSSFKLHFVGISGSRLQWFTDYLANRKQIVVIPGVSSAGLQSKPVFLKALRGGWLVRWCWVNFQCRGVLLILILVGQGPTALAVGAGGDCLDIFSPSLKGTLSPKQPTN